MDNRVLISAASTNHVVAENYTYQSVPRICVKRKNFQKKNGKEKETERKIVSSRKKLSKSSSKKTGDSEKSAKSGNSQERNESEVNVKEIDLNVLGSLLGTPKEVIQEIIRNVKRPSGASLNDIYEETKAIRNINLDYMKPLIDRFVHKAVECGILHKYWCASHRFKF